MAANRSKTYWITKSALIPGVVISSSDLVERRAALYTFNRLYLSVDDQFERFTVTRKIGAGELIPQAAISANLESMQFSAVPVSILSADLPADLVVGEIVNLYQVGDPRLIGTVVTPSLILEKVSIIGVDKKGENLGANISLSLSVRPIDVLKVLNATSSGRLVVVRVNG